MSVSASGRRVEANSLKAAVSLGAEIGRVVRLTREGRDLVGLCPFHSERTPSFRVFADHYHCFGCGAHGDIFTWLMQMHRLSFVEAMAHLSGERTDRPAHVPPAPALSRRPDNTAERTELARRIWCDAVDPRGTPVEAYLRSRGLELPSEPVLRWHPRCPRKGGPLPAMVAKMTEPVTGEPSGVHRTFLQPDGSGKAPVEKPKMMLGNAGAVRLYEPETPGIGLAEGIETALAVAQRIGWGPIWAATSSEGVRSFPILPGVSLTLFADNDDAGLKAAQDCADRWTTALGAEVLIHIPPPGTDWDDATRRLAP
jgi:DNA primase